MLVAASLTATVTRYVALRTWVFARARRAPPSAPSRSSPAAECRRSPRRAPAPVRASASGGSGSRSSPCSLLAAGALPLGPDDQRLLERVLRRGRPRRRGELEGVVLRRDRPRLLHHRRQAAAVAVADGPLGPGVRLLVLQPCCCRRRCARSPRSGCCSRPSGASPAPAAGLIAAAALALTPITVAIGRVNNPDALLVLLLVASAWFDRAGARDRARQVARARRRGRRPGVHDQDAARAGWSCRRWARRTCSPRRPALLVRVRQLAVAGIVMVAVSCRVAARRDAVARLDALHRRQRPTARCGT